MTIVNNRVGARQQWTAVGTATVFWASLLLSSAPTPVEARYDPLYIVKQQIKKPNLLIALDTSGSLVSVPGPAFAVDQKNPNNSTEAGMDCDNGSNCRQKRVCKIAGVITSTACGQDMDCWPKNCRLTQGSCNVTPDCPNWNVGFCDRDVALSFVHGMTNTKCTADADCLQATSGQCHMPGDPDAFLTGPTCGTHTDCVNFAGCGSHASTGDCGNETVIDEFGNTIPSPCIYCKYGCAWPDPNFCATNTCVGKDNGDRCVPDPVSQTGMCKATELPCRRGGGFNDCAAGDVCIAPSSRSMIAKRVITNIINEAHNVVNMGLMTYYQSGYFAYFQAGGTSAQETFFLDPFTLQSNGCTTQPSNGWGKQQNQWSKGYGQPNPVCMGMTLATSQPNSRYYVDSPSGVRAQYELDWCGSQCATPGGKGTYAGSYYTASVPQGGGAGGDMGLPLSPRPTVYQGKSISAVNKPWRYMDIPADLFTDGQPGLQYGPTPGRTKLQWLKSTMDFGDCYDTFTCDPKCGGKLLQPEIDPMATPAVAQQNALKLIQYMRPASDGGLVSFGYTPTGCMLENSGAPTRDTSAYHYVQDLILNKDTISYSAPLGRVDPKLYCRGTNVLLITDGESNGPDDADKVACPLGGFDYRSRCADVACAAANPIAAGCKCRAVTAAYDLRMNLGASTYVIGYGGDVTQASATLCGQPVASTTRQTLENIAKAGGTDASAVARKMYPGAPLPYAFVAANESALQQSILTAIQMMAPGSYVTAPATSSSGTQSGNTLVAGQLALEGRVDYPVWQGHLNAFDMTATPVPALKWDATAKLKTLLDKGEWWKRRVYIGTATGSVIQVQGGGRTPTAADPSPTGVLNAAAIRAQTGLGTSDIETDQILRFAMGALDYSVNPTYPPPMNPAAIGSIVNSTPIDVGPPGESWMAGGKAFAQNYKSRPNLIYVGADDGMLHAFFREDTTVGGAPATVTYPAGSEAFAFIPPDMLDQVTTLYLHRGQPADPDLHVFGLANSPKVKNMCIATDCNNATASDWATVLLMPEGPGGNDLFALDITNPVGASGFSNPPIKLLWHSATAAASATYDTVLGQTFSVPAFYMNEDATAKAEQRIVYASGYQGDTGPEGIEFVVSGAVSGKLVDHQAASKTGPVCAQDYALMTDTAAAKNFLTWKQPLLSAYSGDTWGKLWRYAPGPLGAAGQVKLVEDFGCQQPLYFSPTTVQLDRDDPMNDPTHSGLPNQIFLVQVTNSALDPDTQAYPASQMVFIKEYRDKSGVFQRDPAFGTGGKKVLTVGTTDICYDTDGKGSCLKMPATARPMGTPLGILRKDGAGFDVFSTWYLPPPPNACGKGTSYIAIHELLVNSVAQRESHVPPQPEPVVSPVVAGGQVYVVTANGAVKIDANLTGTFKSGGSTEGFTGINADKRFRTLNWTEK